MTDLVLYERAKTAFRVCLTCLYGALGVSFIDVVFGQMGMGTAFAISLLVLGSVYGLEQLVRINQILANRVDTLADDMTRGDNE